MKRRAQYLGRLIHGAPLACQGPSYTVHPPQGENPVVCMPTEISSEKCVVRFMVSRNFGWPAEYLVRAFSLGGEIEQFVKDLFIYVCSATSFIL